MCLVNKDGRHVVGLSTFYTEMMRGLGASTRVWELIDSKPSIPLTGKAAQHVYFCLMIMAQTYKHTFHCITICKPCHTTVNFVISVAISAVPHACF